MYKLIICDLDGTLVNSKKEISDYTKKVIALLKERGVCFIIATGRNLKGAKHVYDTLELKEEIICNNGSTIYNGKGELIFQKTLNKDITKEIFEKSLKEGTVFLASYGVQLYIADGTLGAVNYFLNNFAENPIEVNLNNISSFTFEKIVLMDNDNDKLKRLSEDFNSFDEVSAFVSQNDFLDIVHFETSKGKALKALANSKNINLKETIAFGDAFNDYEMLKFAGKGLVMPNGFEELKKEFETLSLSNDENGVAKYLAQTFSLDEAELKPYE